MKLHELLAPVNEMSAVELRSAKDIITRMFKELNLDIIWTVHFKDRAQDRDDAITPVELIDAFRKMKDKYGADLVAAKDNHEQFFGLLQDLSTEINVPFSVDFNKTNRSGKYELSGMTIMHMDPNKFYGYKNAARAGTRKMVVK